MPEGRGITEVLMRRRLESAIDECAEMAKTVSERKGVMFDD